MLYPLDDTIVAVASPPGPAARGIVRGSGPMAAACLHACLADPVDSCPAGAADRAVAPRVVPNRLRLAGIPAEVDCDVYCWPLGRSYTGQAVVEIHTLGAPPLLAAIVEAACRSGARPAQPGEFTLRAFLAGRIDLVQAEAVLGVIDAVERRELDVALRQLAGGLVAPLRRLRDELLDMLARLEADLDFPDEGLPLLELADLEQALLHAGQLTAAVARQMDARLDAAPTARVVLVGSPNTGKSTLYNALTGRDAAIVSAVPGTTRDYLVAELDLDGLRCQLVDTAGIDGDLTCPIGAAAQSAAEQQSRESHLRVLCLDATRALDAREQAELAACDAAVTLVVLTKVDAAARLPELPCPAIATSSRDGTGLAELRTAIRARLVNQSGVGLGVVSGTAMRCRHSLAEADACLSRALALLHAGRADELLAAELRLSLVELGHVTGAVYTDDVLDRIFSRFCVGK